MVYLQRHNLCFMAFEWQWPGKIMNFPIKLVSAEVTWWTVLQTVCLLIHSTSPSEYMKLPAVTNRRATQTDCETVCAVLLWVTRATCGPWCDGGIPVLAVRSGTSHINGRPCNEMGLLCCENPFMMQRSPYSLCSCFLGP